MIRKLDLLFAALLFTTVGSTVGQDVSFSFSKNTDFFKFKTYKWVPDKESKPANELMDKQIKETVDSEFKKKGLTKAEAGPADLHIRYQAGIGSERQIMSCNAGWVCVAGWYWSGCFSVGTTAEQTSTICKGELVLDMYDQLSYELVWCGVASKALDSKAKSDKQQKNLQKVVAKLLRSFPPPKK